jgi:hypothetical protein
MAMHRSIYDHNGIPTNKLQSVVPSVFAQQPYEKTSARYGFVPTIDVVQSLESTGLNLVQAGQTVTRIEGKGNFTRHVLRFRPQYAPTVMNEALPEVVLMNSHDGSSGFKLWLGLFRMVCANGMIVSSGTFSSVSVPHRSNAAEIVAQQSLDFLSNISALESGMLRFRERQMTEQEMYQFAEKAAQIRWGNERPGGLDSRQLLLARRLQDAHHNLWAVLNTIQENLTKGGVSLNRTGRRSSTRGLRSVSDDVRMNTQLWGAAESFLHSGTIDVEARELAEV